MTTAPLAYRKISIRVTENARAVYVGRKIPAPTVAMETQALRNRSHSFNPDALKQGIEGLQSSEMMMSTVHLQVVLEGDLRTQWLWYRTTPQPRSSS